MVLLDLGNVILVTVPALRLGVILDLLIRRGLVARYLVVRIVAYFMTTITISQGTFSPVEYGHLEPDTRLSNIERIYTLLHALPGRGVLIDEVENRNNV